MSQVEQSEPLVIADPELLAPEGKQFWFDDAMFETDRSGMPYPNFKAKEVATIFFGRSVDWLRWRMRPNDRRVVDKETGESKVVPGDHPDGYFVLDGKPLEFKRTGPNARYFTLADIEKMAHALAQGGHIDGATLTLVVRMAVTCGRLHGVIA